jgi:AhpC/TSA antioxidant enzyme
MRVPVVFPLILMASSCARAADNTTCSRRLLPAAAVESVRQQLGTVPSRTSLTLPASLTAKSLQGAMLVEIQTSTLLVDEATTTVVKEVGQISSHDVIQRHTGDFGSIGFVVRRPGCVLCREHGLTLSTLAADETKPFAGFGLFGVIKETVDEEGLIEFSEVFPEKLYKDTDLVFYKALGERRLSIVTMLSSFLYSFLFKRSEWKAFGKRLEDKKLKGNLKGEGLLQGGVIVFDKSGIPLYAYIEDLGTDLPVSELVAAVNAVREAEFAQQQVATES